MWRRGLTIDEYRRLQLSSLSPADRRTYLGSYGAMQFALAITGRSARRGLVGDKLYFDGLMRGAGFPVPPVIGVIGRAGGPRIPQFIEGPQLRRALRETGGQMFIKPITAHGESHPIAVTGYDATKNEAATSRGTLPPWRLMALIGKEMPNGAIVQPKLAQHEAVTARIGPHIGSIRLTTLLTDRGPQIVQRFWRIPCNGAVADHMWRGNLLAGLEGANVVRVIDTLDAAAPDVLKHPDTGVDLLGATLPGMAEAEDLARDAADFLSELPLIGWDIALTTSGPVILEANSNPSLDVPQYLRRQGILADPTFAEAWGQLSERRRAQARARRSRRFSALRLQRRR